MPLRREKFAWIMYDFANSGYATVVLTTIYNAYFVSSLAINGLDSAAATLLWTVTIAIGNALILLTAPVVGAFSDIYGVRKKLLVLSTLGCVVFTAMLYLPGPGDIILATTLVIASYYMFATGENLIAAFLPELADNDNIGRLSGYGWSIGFLGGLLSLGLCLAYVSWARQAGHEVTDYVPVTMLIVAGCFLLAATPTLLWLHEKHPGKQGDESLVIRAAFARVWRTLQHLRHYPDLRRFMLTLTCFHAGIYIVILLAAIYAEQVMGFDTQQNIILISIVNITAAIGAFGFGYLQDSLGSIRTLILTLVIWTVAILLVWSSTDLVVFWFAANLIGIALGASQSASRALIGLLSPAGRYGEFFGLWGMCVKLAAIIGPLSYGLLNWLNHGDHQQSILATAVFFIAGIVLLLSIDESRGKQRAKENG